MSPEASDSSKGVDGSSLPFIHLTLAIVSFVLLFLQLALMRMFAHAQGHHLAYVVISLALLGFGASGSFLFLWKARVGRGLNDLFLLSLIFCSLVIAWLPQLASPLLEGFAVDLLASELHAWFRLLSLGALLLLPFFLGATVVAIAFSTRTSQIGQRYRANLTGSALGAMAAIGAFHLILPERALPYLAILLLASAFLYLKQPVATISRLVLFASLIPVGIAPFFAGELPVSEYKSIRYYQLLPGNVASDETPHPMGRVQLVQAPALRFAPDMSLHYTDTVPAPPMVVVDGDTYGVMLHPNRPGADILKQTPQVLPYWVSNIRRTWVLSDGGTPAVNLALAQGASVTVAEPHPIVASKIRNAFRYNDRVGMVRDPMILLQYGRYRAFSPDLIVFPMRGSFGGVVGLHGLGEDHLFTVETLARALSRVRSGGMVQMSAWLDDPLRYAPRILNLAVEALKTIGVDQPEEHLILLRGWGSVSLVVSPDPIPVSGRETVAVQAAKAGFDVLPRNSGVDAESFHAEADDALELLFNGIVGERAVELVRSYRFDVSAPTRNRPFFNQFLRVSDGFMPLWTQDAAMSMLTVSERGLSFLITVLVLLLLATLILIAAPLLLVPTSGRGWGFALVYFAGIGTGFMFMEIALIQRLTLYLGNVTYSAAGVITALLLGMGVGSAWSKSRKPSRGFLTSALLLVAVVQALLLVSTLVFLPLIASLPTLLIMIISLLLLALPAFLLGIPFPMGIRWLSSHNPKLVPWAWGINGCFSVIGSTGAGLMAMLCGFHSLIILSTIAYLFAAGAAAFSMRHSA